MTTQPEIGQAIRFVDENHREHSALVQYVHGPGLEDPTINLVHLSHDPAKQDSYGRQIEKRTSVQHRNRTTATGFFWDYQNT